MTAKLYVVNGSHPSVTAAEGLRIKGIPFKTVEFLLPTQAFLTKLVGGFPDRTVPALKLESGEKVQGSRAILARLEALVPDPPLYGTSPEERAKIEEAEAWGDDVLQAMVRRTLWSAAKRKPVALYDFQAGSKLPKLPKAAIAVNAPLIVGIERKLNASTDDVARQDLAALPGHLDKLDAWIAEGRIGGEQPNAADLQIAPSLRLLHTVTDVRPLYEGRPLDAMWRRYLEPLSASVPAGTVPADWIPSATPATA